MRAEARGADMAATDAATARTARHPEETMADQERDIPVEELEEIAGGADAEPNTYCPVANQVCCNVDCLVEPTPDG